MALAKTDKKRSSIHKLSVFSASITFFTLHLINAQKSKPFARAQFVNKLRAREKSWTV